MVLDYKVDIIELGPSDFVLNYGELGNFSVAGFEMRLRRHVSHYLITYYLPSGEELSSPSCVCQCQVSISRVWVDNIHWI